MISLQIEYARLWIAAFLNCTAYSDNDKNKGVVETLMCMNHFDNWKTQVKLAFKYMNEYEIEEEFSIYEKRF